MASKGHLSQELPRYEYQRIRWAKRGVTEENRVAFLFTMQVKHKINAYLTDELLQCEIFVQCVANMGVLSLPLMIQSAGYQSQSLTSFEMFSWILWLVSLCWEHVADTQKLNFAKENKRLGKKSQVCNVGLWQYCRHPNYFGEWMVWNSLVLATIPSALGMWNQESSLIVKIGLILGLLQVVFNNNSINI